MINIKFAHLGDAHLGAWRKESMKKLVYRAFEQAIDTIVAEKVDFVLVCGDLYDTSDPPVDAVDVATKGFKKLADSGIRSYYIAGSHDFSPSGKSMLRPLESAALCTNVFKYEFTDDDKIRLQFTTDEKTGVKLAGMRARKRGLEVKDYELLDLDALAVEPGPKIFLLHTTLADLKAEEPGNDMFVPRSMLPRGFAYYAAGHVHKTIPETLRTSSDPLRVGKGADVVYPGSLFPVDFFEMEQYQRGGFCIVEGQIGPDPKKDSLLVRWIPVDVVPVATTEINCGGMDVPGALAAIEAAINALDVEGKIAAARLSGTLKSGKAGDIRAEEIARKLMDKGALEALVNRNMLASHEYAPTRITIATGSREDIEAAFIAEHVKAVDIPGLTPGQLAEKIPDILRALGEEQQEGSKKQDYQAKIAADVAAILGIKE